MDTISCITTRRSCRSFKPDMPSNEEIQKVLDAGTWAPSGMNRQGVRLVAVANKEDRDALSKMNAAVMGSDKDPYYGAPVVVVLAEPSAIAELDGAASITCALLEANELGLATCWVNREKEMFGTKEGKALLEKWGLPADLVGIAGFSLGYAASPVPQDKPRKEGRTLIV